MKKIMMAMFFLLLLPVMAGCSDSASGGDLKSQTVITVNDEKIAMDTMMYYIMEQESEYSYDDVYYKATYGTSYWDMEVEEEDGRIVRDEIKDYILEIAQLYEVFNQEAQKRGYKLTDEDIEEAKSNASSIWENMSEHQKEVTELTEDLLVEIFKKISLATKLYDDVDAGLTVDEEAAKNSVNPEDYKEYSIEIMSLDNIEEDEEGYWVDVPKKKLKKAVKRMEQYRKKLKNGKTMEEVVPEDEKKITVESLSFIKGDKQLGEELEEAAVLLENDEHTDIIETDAGYFVIRMADNESTESYDAAVQTAIEDAQTAAFEAAYNEIKKAYKVEINHDVWDQVVIGNLTIDPEDEESVEVPSETSEE